MLSTRRTSAAFSLGFVGWQAAVSGANVEEPITVAFYRDRLGTRVCGIDRVGEEQCCAVGCDFFRTFWRAFLLSLQTCS